MNPEFYIRRKLEHNILPYVICAERLNKSTDYYLYHSYNHSKELVSIASGVGISGPIASIYKSERIEFGGLPIIGIVGIILVGLLRYFGGREELAKKIIGQNRIRNQSKSVRLELNEALQEDNPELVLQKLIEIQQKISGVINTAIQEDIWPYTLFSEQSKLLAKVETEKIISDLNSAWSQRDIHEEAEELPDQR